MTLRLSDLQTRRVLTALDVNFAATVARLFADDRPEVHLAAALASRAVGNGNVCLDLTALGEDPVVRDLDGAAVETLRWPAVGPWLAALGNSPLVVRAADPLPTRAPLVLEADGHLYLERYWQCERRVAAAIRLRAEQSEDVDAAWLAAALDRLGLEGQRDRPNRQRLAAALALHRRLCIISGGPGTGKTYTVAKILALLVEQEVSRSGRAPRIVLLAPTGKAAARLSESIRNELPRLACSEEVRSAIPSDAATIHRALGLSPSGRRRRDPALFADAVVVDEASMIDLGLLDKLLAALPRRARLVLLGDRNQLASVEAGTILADMCAPAAGTAYSPALADLLEPAVGASVPRADTAAPAIADCTVELTENRRYRDSPGIGALAAAIHRGDVAAALAALAPDADNGVGWVETESLDDVVERACSQFETLRASNDPAEQLRELERFRVLCAHRNGPWGVAGINASVERVLARRGRIEEGSASYAGRPLLIEKNDYQVGLFNGDLGVLTSTPGGGRIALFAGKDGVRGIAPSRLPPHATVFAMTVHKSQGSEFDEVAVALPRELSPVVSRELLYTAVTRARRRVTVYAAADVLRAAVERRIRRASGLRALLWG
jgi:exodeoxyribonuclease V alpha subunit